MRRGVSGLISALVVLFVSISMLSLALMLNEKIIEAGERQAEKMREIAEEVINPAPLLVRASERLMVSVQSARAVEVKMFIVEYANGTLRAIPGATLEPGKWHAIAPYSCEPVRIYAIYRSGVVARWPSPHGGFGAWHACEGPEPLYDPVLGAHVIGLRAPPPLSSVTLPINDRISLHFLIQIGYIDASRGECSIWDQRVERFYNETIRRISLTNDELYVNFVVDCNDPAAAWVEFKLRSGKPFVLRGHAYIKILTRYVFFTGVSPVYCMAAASPYVPYGSYSYTITYSWDWGIWTVATFTSSFSTSNIIFLFANGQKFLTLEDRIEVQISLYASLGNITIFEPQEMEIPLSPGSQARPLKVRLEHADRFSEAMFRALSRYSHLPSMVEEGGAAKIKISTNPRVPAVLPWEGRVELCDYARNYWRSPVIIEGSASADRPAPMLSPWKAPIVIEVSSPHDKRVYIVDPDGSLGAAISQGGRRHVGYAPLLSSPFIVEPSAAAQLWVPVELDGSLRFSVKSMDAQRVERYSYYVLVLFNRTSSAAILVRTS